MFIVFKCALYKNNYHKRTAIVYFFRLIDSKEQSVTMEINYKEKNYMQFF